MIYGSIYHMLYYITAQSTSIINNIMKNQFHNS